MSILSLAVSALVLVLTLQPTSMPYLDLLRDGDAHAARSERTAAVAAYEAAAGLRPSDPEPYLQIARVNLDWGRIQDALVAVAQARTRGAAKVDLERMLIAIYAARAHWPAVIEHAQLLLALLPADKDARHALACAHVELGEWDAAQAEYEVLLAADPSDAVAHERLGVLVLGDDPAAVQHLFSAGTDLAGRLVVTLAEGNSASQAHASALLGRALFEAEEWALAARHFERALSHAPGYPDAHAHLGYALDQMGRRDEARRHLQAAVAMDSNLIVGHMFLGLHYDRLGGLLRARAEYEAAYDLDPENPVVCVEIGETWLAERRYVAAEIWFRQAVSLRPDDPALWEVLTRFYLDHGLETAGRGIAAAAELVELSPGDARAHDLQGWAAFQNGDYEAAQDSLLRAISLDPTLASAHYHLGRLWDVRGLREAAQDAFVRALDLDTTRELAPLVERTTK